MKLFVLKPSQELIDDHKSHYNGLVKTGLVQVINEIDDQWRYGFVFRGTDHLTETNSRFYKQEQFTYECLSTLDLPLFNNEFVILNESFFDRPFQQNSFIKPNNKIKAFQPTILKKGEKISSLGLSPEVMKGLEVVVAPVKDIRNVIEIRAVVFDNTLCSLSVISHEDKSIKLSSEAYKFALKCVKALPDCFAYILDIAVTNEKEYSIMEINPIETSGFFVEDYTRLLNIFSRHELTVSDL